VSELDKFFNEPSRVVGLGQLFAPFMEVQHVEGGAYEYKFEAPSPPSTHTSDGSQVPTESAAETNHE
jgi:hypothetical protein